MRMRWKVLSLVAAAVLVLGVFSVAAAQTAPATQTGTNYHQVYLTKLAQLLGVDQAKLESSMTQAQSQTLDQAVKDGQLTQQQADFMKQHMQQAQQGGAGFGPGMMRGGFGGHGPMGPFGGR